MNYNVHNVEAAYSYRYLVQKNFKTKIDGAINTASYFQFHHAIYLASVSIQGKDKMW